MLDPELLALLVCPKTHQDVVPATGAQLEKINGAILLGSVLTAGGVTASAKIDGALIRADGAVAYPVLDDIPVMLVPEALVISHLNLVPEPALHA